eukprot:jgi/Botrbrau1/4739/Bobra.0137s0011.1
MNDNTRVRPGPYRRQSALLKSFVLSSLLASNSVWAAFAPAPAPDSDPDAHMEVLVPDTHADHAALTAHLAHQYHLWTVNKYGKVHPKSELTRAVAIAQQHYANALAVIGITKPHINFQWLDDHVKAKINQFKTHIAHVSPALSNAISISAPAWFSNGAQIYSRSRQWISISPRFISISPCIWAASLTGISIGPNLISVSPRLINVNARALDFTATMIDIKSRGIDVGPSAMNWDAPTTHVLISPRWIQWSPSIRLIDVDHWWPNPVVGPPFPQKGPFPIGGPKTVSIYVNKWGQQVPAPPTPKTPAKAPAPAPSVAKVLVKVPTPAPQAAVSLPTTPAKESAVSASVTRMSPIAATSALPVLPAQVPAAAPGLIPVAATTGPIELQPVQAPAGAQSTVPLPLAPQALVGPIPVGLAPAPVLPMPATQGAASVGALGR